MRHFAISFLLLLAAATHGLAIEATPIADGSWTMVIMPDTQHYADDYPQVYYAQTAWIAAHKTTHNIQMVVHEGDITQNRTTTEWTRVKNAMNALGTAGVPYTMCTGNHDRDADTRTTLFNNPAYFGPGSAYAAQAHFQGTSGGFYEAGKTANSWCTFNAGGQDWLIFSVEYGPNNDTVAWMDRVAAAHPNHNLILNTHAYLYYDDTRYDYATYGADQKWSPHASWTPPDNLNDGQELWDKLIKKYANWKFVFSGHVLADGTGWLGSTGEHGNVVHQLLTNYQMRDEGGEGYLRLLEFKNDGNTVVVSSYSPYLGSYLELYDHDFTLNVDEPPTIHGTTSAAINVADSTNVWTIVGSGPGQVELISPANLADVSLAVNAIPTYRNQGIMIATVCQNSRNGYYGTAEVSQRNLFDLNDNILQIVTSRASAGGEYNVNVAVGFFPFADGWIGGHVQGDGVMLERFGVLLDDVTQTATGRYRITIDGVHALNDGMLFAVGGENGANHVSTAPLADGTAWDVAVRDATATTFSALESARWSFVYIDYDAPGLIGGRVSADGSVVHREGDFSIAHPSAGVYQIVVSEYTPADGALLLTVADYETQGITAPDDNIISYEANGNAFVVNVRDRNGSASPLEDGSFVFAFLPFDERLAPALPGDATRDGRVDAADAAVLAAHWLQTVVAGALDGDFNVDGRVDDLDLAVLSANWQTNPPAGSVPEPSTIVLLGAAVAFLALRRSGSDLRQ